MSDQEAPVNYRLPPARPHTSSQRVKAGCWPVLLTIAVLLSLALTMIIERKEEQTDENPKV